MIVFFINFYYKKEEFKEYLIYFLFLIYNYILNIN